jgi:hypothetical protein
MGRAGFLLLVRIAWDQAADMAVRDVDETRTVDTTVGQTAPEVRRTEVASRLGNGVAAAAELVFAHPARSLRHPLGVVARRGADSGDGEGAQHVHGGRV